MIIANGNIVVRCNELLVSYLYNAHNNNKPNPVWSPFPLRNAVVLHNLITA